MMLGAVMRLFFHIKTKNRIQRNLAASNSDNRRSFRQFFFHALAGPGNTILVQHICLGQNNQVGRINLVFKQFIDWAFVVQLVISSALCLKRVKIVGNPTRGKCRTVNQRDNAIKHHPRAHIRPTERLHERLRQCQARCFNNDMIWRRCLRQKLLHAG